MERLTAYLRRASRRPGSRVWVGDRPDAPPGALPAAIAARVGYPTTDSGWFKTNALQPVEAGTAARLLAFATTTSLAYGRRGHAKPGEIRRAREALADLSTAATFLTNTADWILNPGLILFTSPHLGSSTFEAGLLGYDAAHAFIYWREEED